MKKLTAKFHIALGEAFLVVSLMLTAYYLNLVPDRDSAIRDGRVALAESIAATASMKFSDKDTGEVQAVLSLVVERNDDILSAGLRRTDGTLIIDINEHNNHWNLTGDNISTDAQLTVPIWSGKKEWGAIELRSQSLRPSGWIEMILDPKIKLLLYLAVAGFIVFYFYLTRMLKHLDPSQAVPSRVRNALDTLAEGLLVIDNKGYIMLANQAFSEVTGKSSDKLIGTLAEKLGWENAEEDTLSADKLPWLPSMESGTRTRNDILYLVDDEKKRRTFMVNCSPVIGADNKSGGVLITFEDITVLEEKELELRQSRDEAEAANKTKSEFLANMSHEIRTPMNAILGFTDVLKRGFISSEKERQKHLNTIHSSGTHLLELINDILDLSKVEAGQMTVETIDCKPYQVINDVIQILRVKAEEKDISLDFDINNDIPETIQSDPAKIRQIVTNLVGNAIKFTDDGSVSVNLSFDNNNKEPLLQISITDTGVGIAEDNVDSIFNAFEQADASITRKFGGTGLGLSISQRLAKLLGGDIKVTSKLNEGSSFLVTVATGNISNITVLSAAEIYTYLDSGIDASEETIWQFPESRILVVDDGAENRELVRLVLEQVGIEVDEAEDGQICVDMASQTDYDIILMDVQMPVMDGFTAASTLRQNGFTNPVIALSGNAMLGFVEECLAAGYSDSIPKPVDIDALMTKLAELLGGSSSVKPKATLETMTPEESTAPVADTDDIDNTPLTSRLAVDARFHSVIRKFVTRLSEQLELMQQSLDAEKYSELADLAHWLKGAGGTVGFDDLTEPAEGLELCAKSSDSQGCLTKILYLNQIASRLALPETDLKKTESAPT